MSALAEKRLSEEAYLKLEAYQHMVSIQQYVLVDQTRRKVEVYSRYEDKWLYQMLEAGQFEVACLESTMTINEVY